LVDAGAVVPELLGEHRLVEVLAVEAVADHRVVVLVRQRHPGRLDLLGGRNEWIRHQPEVEELQRAAHRSASWKSGIVCANGSGCSIAIACPVFGMRTRRACGRTSA